MYLGDVIYKKKIMIFYATGIEAMIVKPRQDCEKETLEISVFMVSSFDPCA